MKCLNCGTIILKKGAQHEDGGFSLYPGESQKIEGEEERSFVRCPQCHAKNYFDSWPESKRGGQYYFSSYEFD
jgi:Zn finger protein HypA/HybF involved in hydrogenase expression